MYFRIKHARRKRLFAAEVVVAVVKESHDGAIRKTPLEKRKFVLLTYAFFSSWPEKPLDHTSKYHITFFSSRSDLS